TVAQLLVADPPAVAQSARFSEVARAFLGSRHNHLFVTDSGGRLVGAIVLHDIKPYLADADLDAMVVAADLASPIPSVTPATPLSEALAALARHAGNRLPVVEQETGRLIGAVHKFDLHLAFSQETAAPPDRSSSHPPT
nr:CBS domain-containing protein [Planctomycetota bacterium]